MEAPIKVVTVESKIYKQHYKRNIRILQLAKECTKGRDRNFLKVIVCANFANTRRPEHDRCFPFTKSGMKAENSGWCEVPQVVSDITLG